MLTPLDNGPQPFDPGVSGLVASNKGPSIESLAFNDVENRPTEKPKSPSSIMPALITSQAGFSMDMLKPLSRDSGSSQNAAALLPAVSAQGNYCDPNYIGPPIRFSQTAELTLEDLLNQLNARFGVNFIIGPDVGKLPLNVKAGSIPWNVLLRSQLYVSGVRATCIDSNTIELVRTDKVADLEKARTNAEVLQTQYIKLKYLQPSAGGNKNIAGQSGGGNILCQSASSSGGQGGALGGGGGDQLPQRCKFERLMSEIRQILGVYQLQGTGSAKTVADTGDQSSKGGVDRYPYVGQVPGRNMLIVNANTAQLKEIDGLIRRADVPPFQVVIKAL